MDSIISANPDKQGDARINLRLGLFPDCLEAHFDNHYGLLKTGGSDARDKEGAHGVGPELRRVLGHGTAYVLHITAANILFIVETHRANPLR